MTSTLFAFVAALQTAPLPAAACSPATGFVGTLCVPASSGKHPAMLSLGSSEGGNSIAPLGTTFAQQGYVAASVAYFGLPSFPQTLREIPVETLGRAFTAIENRADVDSQRIAMF